MIPQIPLPQTAIPSHRRPSSELAGPVEKNPWNSREAEADDKKEVKEKHKGNADKKTTPLMGSMKKGRAFVVEGTYESKRRVKRPRCSSPDRDGAVGSQDGCRMRIYTLGSE